MKGYLGLLFLLVAAVCARAQYYEQCLTISGFTDDPDNGNSYNFKSTIRYNASKEFVMAGDAKIYRVSKEGSKLWEKTLTANIVDYRIDNSGNVLAIHNNSTRLIKYNSNGSLAWEKTYSNQYVNRISTDDSDNVYVTGYDFSTSGLLLIKYSSNGTMAWQKTIADGNGNAVVSAGNGDVYVIGNDYNNGGFMLIKYSSGGTLQWQSAINNNISAREIKLGPDNNLYCFLSDDFTTIIYKINAGNGSGIDNILLDYGNTVSQFGPGNSIFVLGTTGTGLHSIYKVNSNFTGALFRNLQTFYYRTFDYKAIEVESDGTVTVNVIDGFDQRSSAFYRMNSSAVDIDDPLFFSIPNTGLAVDYQGSYILPTDYSCLKKFTPCGKIPFSISSQPSGTTVCQGADAQFTVSVTGQGLLYQWKKGSVILTNNSKYAGVNTPTLTVKSANPTDDAGSYTCEVFDVCYVPFDDPERKLTSQAVSITFTAPSTITTQPQNVSQCTGTDAVFQVATSGGQNVKYQWKKGNTVLNESATVVGSKTNTLTLKNIASTDVAEYYCEVTSDCFASPLVSQEASLTLLGTTSVSGQPVSVGVCAGSTAVFSVAASGTGITYQWRKGTVNLTESALYVGTKSATLSIKDVKGSDAGDYSCVITGTCGNPVTSSAGTLTIIASVQITQQPVSKEICSGASTSFSVAATGSGLTYAWKKGNTALTNGGKYSGVNTATLNISSTTPAEEGQYSCTVSSSCGNEVISTVAQLAIGTAPSINSKSADLQLCEGAVAKMSVTVTAGLVTFQWKKNGSALTDGDGIIGSTARELFITSVKDSDAGNYTCDVSSGCGAAQVSGIIKLELTTGLTLEPGVQIRQHCNDEKISLLASATGTVQTYQWKKNGVNLSNTSAISGVKTGTLVIAKATTADAGSYTCELLSPCGKTLLTDAIQVQINPKPELSLLEVECDAFPTEWSAIVQDIKNVFGEYSIYRKGNSAALPGLQSAEKSGIYIIVKSSGTCADSVEWNNDCVITAVEKDDPGLVIAPNPSRGQFNVTYPGFYSFEIYDARGMEVLANPVPVLSESPVDAGHLANGIYYFTLVTESGKRISKRILIQR